MFPTLQAKLIAAALLFLTLAGAFGTYTYHERSIGKAVELAALQKSSGKLLAAATAEVAKKEAAHTTQVTAIVGVLDEQRRVDNLQHISDTDRLREYDAYRRTHAAVASTAQSTADPTAGANGDSGDHSRTEQLEQVASQLAAASRSARDAVIACKNERDSLTGK